MKETSGKAKKLPPYSLDNYEPNAPKQSIPSSNAPQFPHQAKHQQQQDNTPYTLAVIPNAAQPVLVHHPSNNSMPSSSFAAYGGGPKQKLKLEAQPMAEEEFRKYSIKSYHLRRTMKALVYVSCLVYVM